MNQGGCILRDKFKALSGEIRLRIIAILLENNLCVCEMETCLQISQSNVSRHLTVLKNCGILESYKEAQWTYYTISDEFITLNKELWDYLRENLKYLPSYEKDRLELSNYKREKISKINGCNYPTANTVVGNRSLQFNK